MKSTQRPATSLLLAAILGIATIASAQNHYTAGHGDIGIAYEDEGSGPELFLHGHLGSNAIVNGAPLGGLNGAEFEPGDFVTVVPESQKFTGFLPPSFAPTGYAGQLWTISQVEVAGVPFLGFATEELAPADWTGSLTFTLNSVLSPSGSGYFSVWASDSFGTPVFEFSTANPAATSNGNNTLLIPAGTHAHYNIGFTEAGIWQVGITVSGTHATDGPLSDSGIFYFAVVPELHETAWLITGVVGLFIALRMRRRSARLRR